MRKVGVLAIFALVAAVAAAPAQAGFFDFLNDTRGSAQHGEAPRPSQPLPVPGAAAGEDAPRTESSRSAGFFDFLRQPAKPRTAAPRPDPETTGSLPPAEVEPTKELVEYATIEHPGTVVISTGERALYLVLEGGKALKYGIGVGREGFEWSGTEYVTRKQEWPDWRPPEDMRERQPYLPSFFPGGPANPMGARAIYLGHSLYRIHGTTEAHTIGKAVSSGCIRMLNEDIEDLYSRVPVGARVVVL